MPDNTQEQRSWDEHKYNPSQQTGQPMYQNYAPNDYPPPNTTYGSPLPDYTSTGNYGPADQPGTKIRDTPPSSPGNKLWKFVALFTSVVAVISLIVAAVAFTLPRASNNNIAASPTVQKTPVAQAAQQTVSTTSVTPAAAATLPPTAPVQSISTVTTGTVTKNLLLSCGSNCDDPIQVTVSTIQVDDDNGRMIWNTTLKDITGNDYSYSFIEYSLQAQGSQNKILATYSQSGGSLTSNNPYNMQATFAFVPVHNVPYTLTVIVHTVESTIGSGQITFNPVSITF